MRVSDIEITAGEVALPYRVVVEGKVFAMCRSKAAAEDTVRRLARIGMVGKVEESDCVNG